jgi:ABC-type dipeptide/oligopeptide/nickel transport system permease component
MLRYTIKRLLATIPVMALVALFVFSLLYLSPGDPAAVIAGDIATAEDIAKIRSNSDLTSRTWCVSAAGSVISRAATSARRSSRSCRYRP